MKKLNMTKREIILYSHLNELLTILLKLDIDLFDDNFKKMVDYIIEIYLGKDEISLDFQDMYYELLKRFMYE